MASISHRYSIRWVPEQAIEPTSTLVLTLQSGFYIDIRIKNGPSKAAPSCLAVSEDVLLAPKGKRAEEPQHEITGKADTTSHPESAPDVELDWAFAGQSISTKDLPRKCTWEHWVDSRTNLLGNMPISDSGIMFPQGDGKTLEKGSMVNPETGKETEYEEVWEDLALEIAKSLDHEYYVLTLDNVGRDGKERSRGVAMQLGPWFQVIYRSDKFDDTNVLVTEFSAARWKWDETDTRWDLVIDYKPIDHEPPDPHEVEQELRKPGVVVGGIVYIYGQEWVCKELSRKRTGGPN